ncbi:MAG TPA: superoxide dismutase family protein [Gemmatimonadaceae bacterium]|nr:superoxide dismutase family protein [Gemmatimonadaceae bacterium]
MKTLLAVALLAAAACTRATVQLPPSPSPTAPAAAATAPGRTATAVIRDLTGGSVGTATLTDTYSGVLIDAVVGNIGLGAHGIHVHAVGKCEPPFTSAGGHFNPSGKQHGYLNPNGPHLGDLPNITTPAAGQLHFEFLLPGVSLTGTNALLDADGASLVIHGGRDDLKSDPAGNSGARIACGVITLR